MGHGSVAEEIKRRRDKRQTHGDLDRGGGRALPLLRRRRASASWAPRPRWRCRRRSAPTSRSPSTSARPSTWSATTPRARWSARTAGSTAVWTGRRARARGPAPLRDRAGRGVRGPARASRARTWPARGVDGIAIGGSLGQEKAQMHEVVGWALAGAPRRAAAAPARHWRRRRHRPRGRRRIDTFDCATPTRLLATGPRWSMTRTALAARPDQGAHRRAASRSTADCPCPACREHTRGYLHYLTGES